MSINVDKWYNNNKKAIYLYMRKKYPSDITRGQSSHFSVNHHNNSF